jgi:2,3-bisphosphoglycerate-dependent phosphoglycerate mutase
MHSQSQPSTIYHLTLLRHGESQGNSEGRHQGQADYQLTDQGREQVRLLLERWLSEGKVFDLVISSPLPRAIETARIIADGLKVPLKPEPLWMARDNGLLARLCPEEVQQIAPEPDFLDPYQPIGQTGESLWQLYLRTGSAIQAILNSSPGKYLVVSHGGMLNRSMCAILGIPPQPKLYGPRFLFSNSAFATLTYSPASHRWLVLGVNDHTHWNFPE